MDNQLMPADNPGSRRSPVSVRRFTNAADADRHDIEYWRQIPEKERVLQVWKLSQEMWRLRGELVRESGLCRSVARIRRR